MSAVAAIFWDEVHESGLALFIRMGKGADWRADDFTTAREAVIVAPSLLLLDPHFAKTAAKTARESTIRLLFMLPPFAEEILIIPSSGHNLNLD